MPFVELSAGVVVDLTATIPFSAGKTYSIQNIGAVECHTLAAASEPTPAVLMAQGNVVFPASAQFDGYRRDFVQGSKTLYAMAPDTARDKSTRLIINEVV